MRKGFTLVELLAVIVILAVILIIAIPQIMQTIKSTRLKSLESSARLIVSNAERDYLAQQTLNQNYNASYIPCSDVAKLGDEYANCTISFEYDTARVTLEGKRGGKFDGLSCTGTKDDMTCIEGSPWLYVYGAIGKEVISYDIDEDNCPIAGAALGYPEEAVSILCSGGEVAGVSIENYINSGAGVELERYGIITNVVYGNYNSGNVEDFRDLKDSNNNPRNVFARVRKDYSEKYVCTMYKSEERGGEPFCLSLSGVFSRKDEKDSEFSKFVDLFGEENCGLVDQLSGDVACFAYTDDSIWSCRVYDNDAIRCSYEYNYTSQSYKISPNDYCEWD